jgi:MFS family permease
MKLKQQAQLIWFVGVFMVFVSRGVLMSSWSNQGPAIKSDLGLDVSAMGLYQMVFSVGSVIGVIVAGRLLARVGSRLISLVSYLVMAASLIGLGFAVNAHALIPALILTVLIGAPYGIADFDNNFEAGEMERAEGRSRVPIFHFGFSAAVIAGGLLASMLIVLKVNLADTFLYIGLAVAVIGLLGSILIPAQNGKIDHEVEDTSSRMRVIDVLREKRHLKIVTIAFAFIVTEGAATLWIPITLTGDGMTGAEAALAYSAFAIGMALMRVVGGKVADTLGRDRVIRYSAIVAISGIGLFIATPLIHLHYLAIALWGIGDSIGVAMTVAAMSDSRRGAHAKQSLLWLVVYVANFTVGPVLGLLSSVVGNYLSFLFPIVTLVIAFTLSASVKKPVAD